MNTRQIVILWSFGLVVSGILYLLGLSMDNWSGNAFVGIALPLFVIGVLTLISFGRK